MKMFLSQILMNLSYCYLGLGTDENIMNNG